MVLLGAQACLQQDCSHAIQNRARQHPYAASTINLRLAAIRRLAYEASDCGVLSSDLAAGIRRVKGVRRLGVRVGNWLTGPFQEFYDALVAKGIRPEMARLTLARKIAAITLIVWKKGVRFDARHLKPQTA